MVKWDGTMGGLCCHINGQSHPEADSLLINVFSVISLILVSCFPLPHLSF